MQTLEKINVEEMELQGFSRSVAELEWLLLILSLLYYVSPGAVVHDSWNLILGMVIFALFTISFHYLNFFRTETRWKLAIETWAMIVFISWIVFHTGGVHSPLLNLYLLVIIASALTLGKLTTLLEFALITCVYLYMGYPLYAGETFSLTSFTQLMVMFAPFLLVGYLTTMLAADVQYGRKLLEIISETDHLTGVKNRRSLTIALEHELKRSARFGRPFAVMLVDADNLKEINDLYGHDAGDRLLKNLTRIIGETSRDSDVLARTGGDEFIVLLPETDARSAGVIAERIRKAVENFSFDVKGNRITSTVSIGIAGYPDDADSIESLLNKADSAMYSSKKLGRNKVSGLESSAVS